MTNWKNIQFPRKTLETTIKIQKHQIKPIMIPSNETRGTAEIFVATRILEGITGLAILILNTDHMTIMTQKFQVLTSLSDLCSTLLTIWWSLEIT
jgi:hypothetical protein